MTKPGPCPLKAQAENKGVAGIFDFDLGIDLEGIGGGIGLIIAGAVLSFIADYVPGQFGRIGRIGGFALMGFGGLNVLAGAGVGKGDSPGTVLPGTQTDTDISKVRARIIKPPTGGAPERGLLGSSYPIEYSVTNTSTKPLTVFTEFRAKEFPRLIGSTNKTSTFTKTVKVGGGDTVIVEGTIPISAVIAAGVDFVADLYARTGTEFGRVIATSSYSL